METIPNVEKSSFAGKGTLLVSCPRNRELCSWKLCLAGRPRHGVMIRRLFLLATSTSRQTPSLIREGPLLPPLVWRCRVGSAVLQRQRIGRVASVGAANFERRKRANRLQGSGRIVSVLGWHRALKGRRKSGRG